MRIPQYPSKWHALNLYTGFPLGNVSHDYYALFISRLGIPQDLCFTCVPYFLIFSLLALRSQNQ